MTPQEFVAVTILVFGAALVSVKIRQLLFREMSPIFHTPNVPAQVEQTKTGWQLSRFNRYAGGVVLLAPTVIGLNVVHTMTGVWILLGLAVLGTMSVCFQIVHDWFKVPMYIRFMFVAVTLGLTTMVSVPLLLS